jgi:hypothetical protein
MGVGPTSPISNVGGVAGALAGAAAGVGVVVVSSRYTTCCQGLSVSSEGSVADVPFTKGRGSGLATAASSARAKPTMAIAAHAATQAKPFRLTIM